MKLFVIEGLDGAGKSTQIKLLTDYLTGQKFKCEYLHFPRTDQPGHGELIARFLRGEFGSLNEVDPWLVAMLYAGDRKEAAKTISGWLSEGKIVLLDRYTYSNIAYQCAKLGGKEAQQELKKWILELEFTHFSLPRPDLNIFLDVPPQFTERKLAAKREGSDRDYLNGQSDIHEGSLNFQMKVRDIYLQLAEEDERVVAIKCGDENGKMMAAQKISELVISIIQQRKLI